MVLYFPPLRQLLRLSRHSELHSHAPLIPLVSLYFLVVERRRVSDRAGYSVAAGAGVLLAGIALYGYLLLQGEVFAVGSRLPAAMLAFWLSLAGGFVIFFGLRAAREAAFPLAFLALAIPLPDSWVERVVALLLHGSAWFTQAFFQVLGVAFYREGSVFQLSHVAFEIAPECSGIRSSIALSITALLAARVFLRGWWGRGLLLAVVVPLAMVKNAVRIVTLSLLAEHVDMRFLTDHWLHRSGGFVFFGFTLLLMGGILAAIRRLESGSRGPEGYHGGRPLPDAGR